jgi:hypothetical protein
MKIYAAVIAAKSVKALVSLARPLPLYERADLAHPLCN